MGLKKDEIGQLYDGELIYVLGLALAKKMEGSPYEMTWFDLDVDGVTVRIVKNGGTITVYEDRDGRVEDVATVCC